MGASNIASTLRAASVLLKVDSEWDWFITLSASDYPLITQDDMLKNAPILKRLESRIKGKSSALGVGRGRAVAMRARVSDLCYILYPSSRDVSLS
ncbi:hypothetical protein CDL15_Pgr000414 [Punica granatum]|uniref:Uncharacterized protein n=1 Tax=Punica granatum TaxID=22663 RepID=A0A218XSJ3_PUNGR|nr:hypothetical protein CDL15_Pgr000414 [Punica granatum]